MAGAANEVSLGENSAVIINGVVMDVVRGTIREDPAKIMVTDNNSGGFTRKTRGPRDCVVDLEMFWIPTLNPLSNPPNLEMGNNVNAVQIWPDNANQPGVFYSFPVAYVASSTVTIQGDGVQSFTTTLENQGKYLSPQRPS